MQPSLLHVGPEFFKTCQEASKHQQNQRVQGVATSLRGLQEQLRLQEDSKISIEGRAQQLAEFVRELRKQTEALHLYVKERDGQLSVLRSEYDAACIKLTAAKESEEAACARRALCLAMICRDVVPGHPDCVGTWHFTNCGFRLATLELEVAKGRSDLSISSAFVEQLEGTSAHVQQELEQLRVKEKKAVEVCERIACNDCIV